MVKLVIKKGIKSSTKRASTVADRVRRKSPGELLNLLASSPSHVRNESGNTVQNEVISLAREYLMYKYGLSDDVINQRIHAIRSRKQTERDLREFYFGRISESEMIKKYSDRKFMREPGLHETAKNKNKFEIPTGSTHTGFGAATEEIKSNPKLYNKSNDRWAALEITNKSMPKRHTAQVPIQRLLVSNQTLSSKYFAKKRKVFDTSLPDEVRMKHAVELDNWLLQVAHDRPEFAANIAFIRNDMKDDEKKSFRRNIKLKTDMEDLLSEREMAYYKTHPFTVPGLTSFDIAKKERSINREKEPARTKVVSIEDGADEGGISIIERSYPKSAIFDDSAIDNIIERQNREKIGRRSEGQLPYREISFIDKPKYRRKKKSKITKKPITRKPARKVIKVRKPIKKCRCK